MNRIRITVPGNFRGLLGTVERKSVNGFWVRLAPEAWPADEPNPFHGLLYLERCEFEEVAESTAA